MISTPGCSLSAGRAVSLLGFACGVSPVQLRRLAPRGHKLNGPRRQRTPSRPIHLMLVGAVRATSAFDSPASPAGVEHPSVPINLVLNVSPLLLVESTTFTIVQLYETTTSSAPVLPLTSFHARLLLQGLRVWQRGRCIRGRYVRDRLLQ